MERLIFPLKSFIAYVEYLPEKCRLNVVVRHGNKYAYNVPKSMFDKVKKAKNKASFIACNVFKKFDSRFIETVPKETIELITLPKNKYYNYLSV